MDINLIEWHPYTDENWQEEVFYVEWHSAQDGKFSRADIFMIFRAVILTYSRLLAYACNITVSDALDNLHYKNMQNFEKALNEVFEPLPWGTGVDYSKLKKILSSIMVPKL